MVALRDLSDQDSCDGAQKQGREGTACRRERDLRMKQAKLTAKKGKAWMYNHSSEDMEAADQDMKQAISEVIEMPTPASRRKDKKGRGQNKVIEEEEAPKVADENESGDDDWCCKKTKKDKKAKRKASNADVGEENELDVKEEEVRTEEPVQVEDEANAGEWCTAVNKRSRSKMSRAVKDKAKAEVAEAEDQQSEELTKSERRRAAAEKQPPRARSKSAQRKRYAEAEQRTKDRSPQEDTEEADEETGKQLARRKAEREKREAQLNEQYALECLKNEADAAAAAVKTSPEKDEDLEGWEVL